MSDRVLHQFSFSHYALKVRLALARKGLAVKVKNYLPLTQLEVLRLSGQRQVPVLEEDGRIIYDSTEILQYLEAAYPETPLVPKTKKRATEVWLIEDWADEVLGIQVRALALNVVKDKPSLVQSTDNFTGIKWVDAMAPVLAPVFVRVLSSLYNLSVDKEEAVKRLRPTLDRVNDMVETGLLKAGSPTVAEDAVAALISPVIPLGGYLGDLDGHPAIQWASDYLNAAPKLEEI